ncbi:UTP--glucose-1-phosphate uridylyltransferase, putative [Plasmodium sp. gorilla clade G2]|uniref:UTP--glucose-1-phosphate uridylyltransferase, putative n=1 Tax=Plasmodium sp. gorilla clade G2 TaxID=880535 RepID=UPI000D216298|nr:UTP--glucose-1-phosphate uridylyltransferase, putative [Plasmodium sp. gorilla clade G2]SOV11737.1 UTP--glucose-1-phosphate uridylyltransferase, putative [Plasmodium sp. gorilla clade G2]
MQKINEIMNSLGENKKYVEYLIRTQQYELLSHEGLNEKNIYDIINQIKEFELIYPDGFIKYIEKGKEFLKRSQMNINEYYNYSIDKPNNLIKIKFHLTTDIILKKEDIKNNFLNVDNKWLYNNKNKNINKNTSYDSYHPYDNRTILNNHHCVSSNDKMFDIYINKHYPTYVNGIRHINDDQYIKKEYYNQDKKIKYVEEENVCDNNCSFININNNHIGLYEESNILTLEKFLYYEKIGLDHIDKISFILLAGGLGERLKHKDIKIKLFTNLISEQTYIEYYCNHIKCFERYIKNEKKKKMNIPFIIMLSDDTYEKTLSFFEEKNYFGLEKNQVHFLKQNKVFCFKDNQGHLDFTYKKNTFIISKKPHGHGDIHYLINKYNILDKLIKDGYKYLFFFQDTNALALKVLFVCLGVSIQKELHMNFLAVSRKPGEEIGTLCTLNNQEKSMTINLEYNIFDSLLSSNGIKENIQEDGFSLYPGNTSAILYEINKYNDILKKTNGCIPEYINPKYMDDTRDHFKTPTRIESMMQDIALYFYEHKRNKETQEWTLIGDKREEVIGKKESMTISDSTTINNNIYDNKKNNNMVDINLYNITNVGVTELDRWLCFSPVKNNSINAYKKILNNIHPECMFSAETDLYYSNCRFIQLACIYNKKEFILDKIPTKTFNGISYFLPPKILIEPDFSFTLTHLIKKIKGNITIKNGATLWLKTNAMITNLYLDGTLIIENKTYQNKNYDHISLPIILDQNVYIKNKGYKIVPTNGFYYNKQKKFSDHIEQNIYENIQIRGYNIIKKEALIITN